MRAIFYKFSDVTMNLSLLPKNIIDECLDEAVQFLAQNALEHLDALVGDCSCQIRAFFLLQIHRKFKNNETFTDDEKEFLALTRFLTRSKKITFCPFSYKHLHETHDFNRVVENCSITKGKELIRVTQNRLAELSVNFMQNLSLSIDDAELQKSLRCTVLDSKCFKRKICPAYPVMKTILMNMLHNDYPLFIKMLRFCSCANKYHELSFFYKPHGNSFSLASMKDNDLENPALIITGYSQAETSPASADETCSNIEEFKNNFKNVDIKTTLLAWFANHPQYVGDFKNFEIPYDELQLPSLKTEMANHKKIYLMERDTFFSVYHIYASSLAMDLKE